MDNTQNKPSEPAKLSPQQVSWYSDCIIVTCTEGGMYTKEDYKKWTKYKHSGEDNRAEVTIVPHDIGLQDNNTGDVLIHVTPEYLATRFTQELIKTLNGTGALDKKWIGPLAKALAGDDNFIPDVVEAGALLQIAIYGEVVYG
jgi:hypothetical protein